MWKNWVLCQNFLSGKWFLYGGRATKCFMVNLFIKTGTNPYRYILTRYCTLTYKKRFCDKQSPRYEKMSSLSKLSLWHVNFHVGVGIQNVPSFYLLENKINLVSWCLFDTLFPWAISAVYFFPYVFSLIWMYFDTTLFNSDDRWSVSCPILWSK